MQCETEEQCTQLARLLPPTEYALLDWAINLMADVVQQEHLNKMNARNIAVVFAPNMTQVSVDGIWVDCWFDDYLSWAMAYLYCRWQIL